MFKNGFKINKVICVLEDVLTKKVLQSNVPNLFDLRKLAGQNQTFVQRLQFEPLKQHLECWLQTLRPNTRENYRYYVGDMIKRKILHVQEPKTGRDISVGEFNNLPHELMLDYIKTIKDWSDGTQQVRAACYISFTKYLERISQGAFRAVKPSTLKANPTFFKVRDKCATNALKINEWHRFIKSLEKINKRDALLARCLLQGAKRVSEALSITLDDIDWDNRLIKFRQSKTVAGLEKLIFVTYPERFMEDLKSYIEETSSVRKDSPWVFITRTGNKVNRRHVLATFRRASDRAGMAKVTPHVLRATWVTFMRQQGVSDTDIMKVTGHASSDQILQYDKTESEDNVTRRISLI